MSVANPEQPESPLDKNELLFAQLVLGFQATAYQQMGKVINPFTGKIERNLESARHSIDMLAMIQEKAKGNLSESEAAFLDHVLAELRMNYVEETNKPQPPREEGKPKPPPESSEPKE
jgi:hypothetical protein